MPALWNKGTSATEKVENFTVGNDRELDLQLAKYDVIGSQAHIQMLQSIGLLTEDELGKLSVGLNEILEQIEQGDFHLDSDAEDIHSQVENMLTAKLGEVGKKIHSGRSRNDQVLVDVKLFLRDQLLKLRQEVSTLFDTLQKLSERYKEVLMPGYTHAQIAMPSSFGLWFGAYAESLASDMQMLRGAYKVINCNPLGSAAGYGNSFPLNRTMTTKLLSFDDLEWNSIAAQLSRGKSEKCVAGALGCVALTLNKFASDCCMYMSQNYGFIHFPDALTTGSSIMPHKKNPDVWEIMRGKCNMIMAAEGEISMMLSNMPHGYHRDYQLLKDVLFPRLALMHECLDMADYMLQSIEINPHILEDPKYRYIFTVEEVNRRTLSGTPFRDAYKQVGIEVNEGRFDFEGGALKASDLHHTHEGSLGNLCTEQILTKFQKAANWQDNE